MSRFHPPTPYDDVNAALRFFEDRARVNFDGDFLAMYLYGSLALGDFDPLASDLDFVVVTRAAIMDNHVEALRAVHQQFDAGDSPWSRRIEALYLPQPALQRSAPGPEQYPQVEKGTQLFLAPLEIGWAFQLHTLREHGLVVAGPRPRDISAPVGREDMRRAAAAIVAGWQDQAAHDPQWLAWLREKDAQSFVVLTLCRVLYSLHTGDVTSKPAAARWAVESLDPTWSGLVRRALAGQHLAGPADEDDVVSTLAFLRLTGETTHA